MKVLFTLLFVFSTTSLFGDFANIRPSWSGAWFNPDQSGHGISVEVLDDDRTIFFWYTYDLNGNPFWLIADGVNSEIRLTELFLPHIRIEATAYHCAGMIYGEFDPATKNCQEWGAIVLDFPYWQCDQAHMEWFPIAEGFGHGSTHLERLTTVYDLDCVESQDPAGNWEVQFGKDTELRFQVEVVTMPNPDIPGLPYLLFEFSDEADCLWSGQIHRGFGIMAEWSAHCGATSVTHAGDGRRYFEYKLCNSENECERKDEVLMFEDDGEYLIFSR